MPFIKCAIPGCENHARINSLYCSNKCRRQNWRDKNSNHPSVQKNPHPEQRGAEVFHPGCCEADHMSKARMYELLEADEFYVGTRICIGQVTLVVE